ncbi:hypothetical protein MADA3029_450006 [Vibrio nigripulchritudo MADA3029]|nr:hypothetical protein VIBNIMADA3021_530006 [Vibrio nigripulchritudo MADA3021]CCN59608.1 hypothetical protein MADA3029_450006 [Vibrio nigripulchritudo MADA3029]
MVSITLYFTIDKVDVMNDQFI